MRTDLDQRYKAEDNSLDVWLSRNWGRLLAEELIFEVELEWWVVVLLGCKGDKGIQIEKRECAKCCRRGKKNVYLGNGEKSLGAAEDIE